MRLVVALMLAGGLVGCASADLYQKRAQTESARQFTLADAQRDQAEAFRKAGFLVCGNRVYNRGETCSEAISFAQKERELIEYAERWNNDQLRKQGYVVCEQRSAKVLACK